MCTLLCPISNSTHFSRIQNIINEVSLNPSPPGSLNGLIPGSPGSRGPQSTEWTMCHTTNFELYDKNQQPSTHNPLLGHLGGTQLQRVPNLVPISSPPSTPSSKKKVTPQTMIGKTWKYKATTIKQPSIMDFILKGKK